MENRYSHLEIHCKLLIFNSQVELPKGTPKWLVFHGKPHEKG